MASQTKSSSVLPFLPVLLTASVLVLAASATFLFGAAGAGAFAVGLPVALVLLWTGRDVLAPLDRITNVDAERARERARTPAPQELSAYERAA